MVIHCNYDKNMQYHYSYACLRNFSIGKECSDAKSMNKPTKT